MKEFGIPATAPELSGATDSFRFLSAPENVLVFTLDRSGRCDFVSPSWVSHTGRRRSEDRDARSSGQLQEDVLEASQGLDHRRTNVGTQQRECRHIPLPKSQPVEDSLNNVDCPLTRCHLPAE